MGFYDRDYYRDDNGGPSWFSGVAPACKTIIVINAIAFFFAMSSRVSPFRGLEANSDAIFLHGHVWQLLTATFIHKDILHLVFNMLFLWVAGREVESRYGTREFACFYLAAAVFSTLIWALTDRLTPLPGEAYMIGASGAILAVVTLYVMDNPRREILLFFVLPVEAWLFLVGYIGLDLLQLVKQLQGGDAARGPAAVAFAAHLGGALYGFLFKRLDLRWGHWLSRKGRRPRLRVVSPPPARERERISPMPASSSRSISAGVGPKASAPSSFPAEQLDARLDEVLAKIAREGGRSGLTEEEQRILEEASRRARDRRNDRT